MPITQENWGQDWFHNSVELQSLIKPDMTVIEVGSYYGRSSKFFAERVRNLICIDHWLGSPDEIHMDNIEGMINLYDQFTYNMRNFDNVLALRVWSSIGLRFLKKMDCKPDLIYIDAGHTYKDVLSDLQLANEFKDCIICGDDYLHGQDDYGVKRAVSSFVQSTGFKLRVERDWFWEILR